MKVILDTNIWIPFFFGRHFTQIADILRNDSVEIYVSDELISEIKEVALRPKFATARTCTLFPWRRPYRQITS